MSRYHYLCGAVKMSKTKSEIVKSSWIYALLTRSLVTIAITWRVSNELRVQPLKDSIKKSEITIKELNSKKDLYEKKASCVILPKREITKGKTETSTNGICLVEFIKESKGYITFAVTIGKSLPFEFELSTGDRKVIEDIDEYYYVDLLSYCNKRAYIQVLTTGIENKTVL